MIQFISFSRIVILALLVLGFWPHLQAQQAVTLINGSIIKGTVIPDIDSNIVRVETNDGSQWVFEKQEVQLIEAWELEEIASFDLGEKSGYYNITDVGLLMGNDAVYSITTISAQTVSGYRINEHWSIGLGIGIESFNIPLAPAFVEGRYHLLKRRLSPFVSIQGGYGIPLENYIGSNGKRVNRGGLMLNPMFGFKHQVTKNIGLVMSGGYRHQQSISNQNYWWFAEGDSGLIRTQYNRFVFRLGFIFS
jgi:hypothetical protein